MKPKHLLALVFVGVLAAGSIMLAMRKKGPPVPVPAGSVPPDLLGSALEEGWTTYGWYSYQGASKEKLWIRVDKGPLGPEEIIAELPWRWSIYVDRTDASGYVPIAKGEKTGYELALLYKIDALGEWSDSQIAETVARAGADQIDAMYSEAA